MKKLSYYMKLKYKVQIELDFNDENKIVFYAFILELGKHACYGRGYTIKQAIKSLTQVKKEIFEYFIEKNTPIPLPKN